MITAQDHYNALRNPYANAACGCTIIDRCLKAENLATQMNTAFDFWANTPGDAQRKLYEGYEKQVRNHDHKAQGIK